MVSDDTPRCGGSGWIFTTIHEAAERGEPYLLPKHKCDGCPDCICETCKGAGEVEGQVRNAYFPDMMDDVPLVCNACEGTGRRQKEGEK